MTFDLIFSYKGRSFKIQVFLSFFWVYIFQIAFFKKTKKKKKKKKKKNNKKTYKLDDFLRLLEK